MGTWSEALIETTREQAYPGAMMKNSDGRSGMLTERSINGIKICAIKSMYMMPVPTDEIIASFTCLNDMITAGWVID